MPSRRAISKEHFDAVLLDLDGVLTDTASIHATAWKETFDGYLRERTARTGEPFRAFDRSSDYLRYVDGKPRYDGAASFLASRGIALSFGEPADPPERETVCGIANRKDRAFSALLARGGVEPYPGSLAFAGYLREHGIRTAVVTSSKHGAEVLAAAGIRDVVDELVDGNDRERLDLAGKPQPDTYLEAARRLGATSRRAVVVEDALAGVEAGRRGGFGLVVGVDRQGGEAEALRRHGADVVVDDLGSLLPQKRGDAPERHPS